MRAGLDGWSRRGDTSAMLDRLTHPHSHMLYKYVALSQQTHTPAAWHVGLKSLLWMLMLMMMVT
jgi:hypothetical protein